MKSRITIEVDFDNGNAPIIKIIQQQSSDVRDALLCQFVQSLKHTSRWLRIEYKGNNPVSSESEKSDLSYQHQYHIIPLTPDDFHEELPIIQSALPEVFKKSIEWNKNHSVLLKAWIDKMLSSSGLAKIGAPSLDDDSPARKFIDMIDGELETERLRWL